MKGLNLSIAAACEKIQEMLNDLDQNQKIRGEIHRFTAFQDVIDTFSRTRADLTMVLGDEIIEEGNLLNQIKEIIDQKNEITIALLSFAKA